MSLQAWALLGAGLAVAGYGDAVDGHPSGVEREVHLWVDAVRAAPEAFADDYAAGGCGLEDFATGERSPRALLAWNADLARAARDHTADMQSHDFVDHPSSDGTSFQDRLDGYYDSPNIGENVAYTGGGAGRVVLSVWMCSPPHRTNILDAWDEIGAGALGAYYTVDFGRRGAPPRVLTTGTHAPEAPTNDVVFRTVWRAPEAPDALDIVLDGDPIPMLLETGAPESGLYVAVVASGSGCHTYWFRGVLGGVEVAFPEEGSFGWGDCAWDDPEARWMATQVPAEGDGPAAVPGCGCGGAGPTGGWASGLAVLLAVRRRRAASSSPARPRRPARRSPAPR